MRRARNGDPRALETLVREASPGVYRFVLRMVRSEEDAKELTQETFLKALAHMEQYDPRYRFTTWLYRIARNLCIDRARRASHWRWTTPRPHGDESGDPMADQVAGQASQLDELMARERQRLLDQAIDRLRPIYREVLVLYHFEGLSYQEISEVLGTPIGTVMNRIFRARKQLRGLLAQYDVFVQEDSALEVAT